MPRVLYMRAKGSGWYVAEQNAWETDSESGITTCSTMQQAERVRKLESGVFFTPTHIRGMGLGAM